MIIIFGNESDSCAKLTYRCLLKERAEVIFINESKLLETTGLSWFFPRQNNKGFLSVDSMKVLLEDLSGVFNRLSHQMMLNLNQALEDQRYISFETYATLTSLLNSLECRVINRPVPGKGQAVPFSNARTIRSIIENGFKLPKTLVTSKPENALSFYEACGHKAIVGHSSSPTERRLITGREGSKYLREALAVQPVYIQELPAGRWVELFTVANRVFASCFANNVMPELSLSEPAVMIEPSMDLQERCCKLAEALGLRFSSIVLLQTEQGEDYCFDIFGFPSIDRCEPQVKENVIASLASELTEARRRPVDDPGFWSLS